MNHQSLKQHRKKCTGTFRDSAYRKLQRAKKIFNDTPKPLFTFKIDNQHFLCPKPWLFCPGWVHPTGNDPPTDQTQFLYILSGNPEDKDLSIVNGIVRATKSMEIHENSVAIVSFKNRFTVVVVTDSFDHEKTE
jgi:hypothetical protein